MNNFEVCGVFEHVRFGQRKEECEECQPVTEPRMSDRVNKMVGPLGAMYLRNLTAVQTRCTELLEDNRKLKLENALLNSENAKLKKRINEGGITLRGWWCVCDKFNSSEQEELKECGACGKKKSVRP